MEQNVVESRLLTRTRMERHSKQINAKVVVMTPRTVAIAA